MENNDKNDRAIPAGDATEQKQGGLYCGCCCDYRRAVIVLAILGIIFAGFNMITVVTVMLAQAADLIEDITYFQYVNVLGYGFSLLVACVSLYGGVKYNVTALRIQIAWLAIWYVVYVVVGIINVTSLDDYLSGGQQAITIIYGIIFQTLFTALAMYPTVYLVKEIRAGTMSAATYDRERHSCCCA